MDGNEDEKVPGENAKDKDSSQRRKDPRKSERDTPERTQYGEISNREEQKNERQENSQMTQIGEIQNPSARKDVQEMNEQTQMGEPDELMPKKSLTNDLQINADQTQYGDAADIARKKSGKKDQRWSSEQARIGETAVDIADKEVVKSHQSESCERTQYGEVMLSKSSGRNIPHATHEQTSDEAFTTRKTKSRFKEKMPTPAVLPPTVEAQASVDQPTDRKEKGRLLVAEMRTRQSKKKKEKKNVPDGTNAATYPATGATVQGEITKLPCETATPIAKKPALMDQHKEPSSIKERLKRGIRTALNAFSRASFEQAFQSAKAKVGFVRGRGIFYDYQDSYLGGGQDDDDDGDEEVDIEALKDTTHRPDLVLVNSNNTNRGRIFNEKGTPFWKDKIFREELPKNKRKPLSSLLFQLADKKLTLKESVATPAKLDGLDDLHDLKKRDSKHFNEELLISNTVRSIIGTLDGLDEYAKKQPQRIRRLEVVEPKTAVNYSRHHPKNQEEVPFVYSGLGVCKTKTKKTKKSSSTSTSTSSSSTTDSSRSRRKRKKKKKGKNGDNGTSEALSDREKDKKRTKRKFFMM